MAEYLSPAWIEEMADAVAHSPEVAQASDGVGLSLDVIVGPSAYHIAIDHGVVAVAPGQAAHADLQLIQDRASAVAIARGELNAQRAFVDGTVRLVGPADRLIAARAVLEAVDHATEDVRKRTTYA